MKKIFYSMLLLAVAGMMAMTFASCTEEKEEVYEPKPDNTEHYFYLKYYLSNDVLELTDVTVTGLDLKFTKDATFGEVPGKVAEVELTGKEAESPKFTVNVTLKSNWKELLAKKERFDGQQSWGYSTIKGEELKIFKNSGSSFKRSDVPDNAQFEEMVSACVERKLGASY